MVAALLWMLVTIWNTPPATLGEASMREAVRRQRMAPATRVINDETVGPPPVRAVPTEPDVAVTDPAAAAAAGARPEAKPELKDPAWWRARMAAAREALERDRLLVTALESRVAALATDIVNRDDPAQRALLVAARIAAIEELERMQKQVMADEAAILEIEEDARKAGVPPGWLRLDLGNRSVQADGAEGVGQFLAADVGDDAGGADAGGEHEVQRA